MTPAMKNWCKRYETQTGFEPTIARAEFDSGQITFAEFAEANVNWFDRWATGARQQCEHNLRDVPEAEYQSRRSL